MENLQINFQALFFSPDRIGDLVAALLITMIIGMLSGPVAGNLHSLVWQGLNIAVGGLGARLDKEKRKRADLVFRGLILTALTLVLALLIGVGAEILSVAEPFYGLVRIAILSCLLSGGAMWFLLVRLQRSIESGKAVQGVFFALARSSRTNLTAGDDFGVSRAAISLSVLIFDKSLVGPAFWYWLGGFPAAFAYTALAMLVWRFGYKGHSKGFASAAILLERVLGFVPSVLSAVILTLAGIFTPTVKSLQAIKSWFGRAGRAPYEQGGAPLSAVAWALNVSVGGPIQDLGGYKINGNWIGSEGASAKVSHKHLRRALYMNVVAHILLLALLIALYMGIDVLNIGQGIKAYIYKA